MRFLIVTDDADRATLEEAIRHLRERQRRCVISSTRLELQADIDELLEMLHRGLPAELQHHAEPQPLQPL